ncbi:MAG: hypothetical protein MUC52_02530, partial [Candidatus Omnitrophica bacterium]|nr:hypothetical protein [Candidatus Omnitrophota bacterium]
PYIKWNENWRQLLAAMVNKVNEHEHGGLAAGYKELTGRAPGQINSFIVELPIESLVLTGYDLNGGAYQLDGGEAQRDGGSELEDVAGVDFRGLPVGGQPANVPVMVPQLEKLAQCSKMVDMDKEWLAIQREMAGRSVPYEKIKEYIAVCMNKPGCRKHLDKAAACLISILRIEEEQALPTRSELKDLLICLG